ncbi:MAG: nicotinate-nucleotide adenylyltransferase [Lachnospiraceae bacterium]|jgi:nicotinate-nucleotide adenylyltransferase|nr:nicotinate-nucleotide adenylyltransferase [Lachnospiraceae bacterium]
MAEIGIMGGTFDPIHNGHLLLGRQAYTEYHLDEIWFMPSGTPPHKKDHVVTSAEHRIEMVRLAIKDYPGFVCSDFEIWRQGNTYTAETLRLLHKQYLKNCFYFIIGADSLYQIENWYHPAEVMKQCVLLVAHREYEEAHCPVREQADHLRRSYKADIRFLHCPEVDIASGELREMVREGKGIHSYVPESVEAYIQTHRLYQDLVKPAHTGD